MSKMFQVYGIGQALIPVLPPPLPFGTAPNSNQTNYEIGQIVYTPAKSPTAFYLYGGSGNWIEFATNSGSIVAINGTTNQVTVTTVSGVSTISLPIVMLAPGSFTATTAIVAGTSITSTLGNITATNGNFVLGTAGNKLVYTSVATTTAAGANSAGTVALVGGTATVSTTAVGAASRIRLTCQALGTVSVPSALCASAKSTGVSFTILASQGTDTSTIFWEIVN